MGLSESKEVDCRIDDSKGCHRLDKSFFNIEKVIEGKECDTVWNVKSQIGEPSNSGKIYNVCCDQKCKYVLKEVYFHRSEEQKEQGYTTTNVSNFLNEIKIQKFLSEHKLAPEPYDIFLNKEKGAFVMSALGTTSLRKILDVVNGDLSRVKKFEIIEDIFKNIYTILDNLHKLGVYHGDPHLNNFMTQLNDDKLYVIDFGYSKMGDMDNNLIADDYIRLLTDLIKRTDDIEREGKGNHIYLLPHIEDIKAKIMIYSKSQEESKEEKTLLEKAHTKFQEYKDSTLTPEDIPRIEHTKRVLDNRINGLQEQDLITKRNIRILSDMLDDLEKMIEMLLKQKSEAE